MICPLCGRMCDYSEYGVCVDCVMRIHRMNEKVYLLSLLKETTQYVSDLALLDKIYKVINKKSPE